VNEQLQDKLVEILSGIQEATRAAGDFAMAQLPDIAQSYVMYGRVASIVNVLFAIAAVALGAYMIYRCKRHIDKASSFLDTAPEVIVPLGVGGMFVFGLGAFSLKGAVLSSALVWFAPKVWLLKELASLIK
jgi:hypothetical protein